MGIFDVGIFRFEDVVECMDEQRDLKVKYSIGIQGDYIVYAARVRSRTYDVLGWSRNTSRARNLIAMRYDSCIGGTDAEYATCVSRLFNSPLFSVCSKDLAAPALRPSVSNELPNFASSVKYMDMFSSLIRSTTMYRGMYYDDSVFGVFFMEKNFPDVLRLRYSLNTEAARAEFMKSLGEFASTGYVDFNSVFDSFDLSDEVDYINVIERLRYL